MTAYRIWVSRDPKPTIGHGCPILPISKADQRALDILRERREKANG
ncbi:MAG TPA: hypothetical protein VFM48_01830 [Aquabacterium sp.]|nr:hypothetical protein [Aquabacterium sp.]